MAFKNKDLRVGDILIVKGADTAVCMYLGKYTDEYVYPDSRHLYLYLDPLYLFDRKTLNRNPDMVRKVVNEAAWRLTKTVNDFGYLTVNYKRCEERIAHIELKDLSLQFQIRVKRPFYDLVPAEYFEIK